MFVSRSVLVLVFCVVSSVSICADTFVFEDTTSDVPGSVFTLSITPKGGQDFFAMLTVSTVATSPDWYINYLTLRLDGDERPLVENFGGPTGNWNAIGGDDSEVDLKKKEDFPRDDWIGFYTNGIVADGSIDITEGVLLDGGTATWFFDFTLDSESNLDESPRLQVGYYDYNPDARGGRGKYYRTQMSQQPDVAPTPEPGTLLLVGSGLLGGAFFRKRLKQ